MAVTTQQVFEFRGVDNLVYAKVEEDSTANFTTGEVKSLSPVAEIGKTTEVSSSTSYYDNQPMIVINSTGSDTLTITCAPLQLETLADITGQTYDAEKGAMVEGDRGSDYYAIGYRTKGTDGKYRYVWRFKGQFGIPDETNQTENNGTDTTNTTLTYTGINTTHKFTDTGKTAKALVVDERYDKADLSTFFEEVTTPDTLTAKGV